MPAGTLPLMLVAKNPPAMLPAHRHTQPVRPLLPISCASSYQGGLLFCGGESAEVKIYPGRGLTQRCEREHEAKGAASLLRDVVISQNALRTWQHQRKSSPIEGRPGHRLQQRAINGLSRPCHSVSPHLPAT